MAKTEKAMFAAGCFWGVQNYFDQIPGVLSTMVGYAGGDTPNPTYEQVCTDKTGHAESILIEFDPDKVSYRTLVRHFFRMHDPTQIDRQGPDIGTQYRSIAFYFNEDQKLIADEIKANLMDSGAYDKQITTHIVKARPFYKAEEYHQKYVEKTGHGACHVEYKPLEDEEE